MVSRSWRWMPKTATGMGSVAAAVVMLVLFPIGSALANTLYKSVSAGETILADISARPVLALTMLAGMTAGIAALITGIDALFRKKENAFLVYISSALGMLLVLFLVGELMFPH